MIQMSTEKNILQRIIADHAFHLASKGYDEHSLRAFSRPGTFLAKLEEELALSLILGLTSPEPRRSTLSQTGCFHKDHDVVVFKFHYEYRPAFCALYLNSLSVCLEHGMHEYPIGWIDTDLPSAAEAHARLTYDFCRITGPEESDQEIRRRSQLATSLWREHRQILRAKGYRTEDFSKATDSESISHPLHRRLVECLRHPFLEKVDPLLIVPAVAHFDHDDNVTFRLLYHVNPRRPTIRPVAMEAQMHPESRFYFLYGYSSLPHADTAYLTLCRKTVLAAARNIHGLLTPDAFRGANLSLKTP
jgi:hypothetical protein